MNAETRREFELQDQIAELVAQQAAISEVLRAIANSPHDLQPIFDTILANATRLCRAELGALKLWEGNSYRIVSQRNLPPSFYAGWEEGRLFPVLPGSPHARVAESRSSVHVADLTADQSYVDGTPVSVAWVESGVRTYLLTPLLKEDELVGLIVILRTRVQPFTDNQVNLVTTFAAEATVALESIRRERRYRDMQMELAHGNRPHHRAAHCIDHS
jgi:GAF domain-containing protein